MDPQESAPIEQEDKTGLEPEAVETSTPDVTEGAPSSGAAEQEEKTAAEKIRDDFLEKYGEEEEATGEETPAPEAKPTDESEAAREKAPDEIKTDQDDGDGEFRISDEEFKALPEGARKRIGHLNTRARKAERKLSEIDSDYEVAVEAKEKFEKFQGFVQSNNIEPQNVTVAFDAMAKLSAGDHQGFLDQVMPWVTAAQHAIGAVLPEDLQAQVDDGYMTEEAAKDLSRSKAAQAAAEAKAARLEQKDQQRSAADTTETTINSIATAVSAREAEIKSSDPDYAHKADAVRSFMEFALESGAVPKTVEEAVGMVNKAYENANKSFKPAAPKPAPKPTLPSPSASSVSRGQPAAENLEDAIGIALESMPST